MKIDSISDIGVRRKDNQDNYWSAILDIDGLESGVVCVCDGMGGLSNGGIVSSIVTRAVKDYVMEFGTLEGLRDRLDEKNTEVFKMAEEQGNRWGTTCSVVLCMDGVYQIYQIGDSRVYRITDGTVTQITRDHSAIVRFKIDKKTDPEKWNKYKNLLTMDYFEGRYKSGDVFFVCSDGCWHYLDDVGFTLDKISDLNALIQNCIKAGETDNLTASVLYV